MSNSSGGQAARNPGRFGRLTGLDSLACASLPSSPFSTRSAICPTLLDSIAAQTRAARPARARGRRIERRLRASSPSGSSARTPSRRCCGARRGRRRRTGSPAPHELRAFTWALGELGEPWDVVAKLDADLRLAPTTLAVGGGRFRGDPRLGVAGPRLLYDRRSRPGRVASHSARARGGRGQVLSAGLSGRDRADPADPRLGHDRRGARPNARMAHDRRARGRGPRAPPAPHGRPRRRAAGVPALGRLCVRIRRAPPLRPADGDSPGSRERPAVLGGMSYVAGWAGRR